MKEFDPFAPVDFGSSDNGSSWAFETENKKESNSSFYNYSHGSDWGSSNNFYSTGNSSSNFYSESKKNENSFWGNGSAWESNHDADRYRGWVDLQLDEHRNNFHHFSDMNSYLGLLDEKSWMNSVERSHSNGSWGYSSSWDNSEKLSSWAYSSGEQDKNENFYSWNNSKENESNNWAFSSRDSKNDTWGFNSSDEGDNWTWSSADNVDKLKRW